MARKPRVHLSGALYHVISRGNQRQDIFLDDKDLKTYLSYLSESQGIIKFENWFRKDKHLEKMIEKLKEDLIKKGKRKYFITITPAILKTPVSPFRNTKRSS